MKQFIVRNRGCGYDDQHLGLRHGRRRLSRTCRRRRRRRVRHAVARRACCAAPRLRQRPSDVRDGGRAAPHRTHCPMRYRPAGPMGCPRSGGRGDQSAPAGDRDIHPASASSPHDGPGRLHTSGGLRRPVPVRSRRRMAPGGVRCTGGGFRPTEPSLRRDGGDPAPRRIRWPLRVPCRRLLLRPGPSVAQAIRSTAHIWWQWRTGPAPRRARRRRLVQLGDSARCTKTLSNFVGTQVPGRSPAIRGRDSPTSTERRGSAPARYSPADRVVAR